MARRRAQPQDIPATRIHGEPTGAPLLGEVARTNVPAVRNQPEPSTVALLDPIARIARDSAEIRLLRMDTLQLVVSVIRRAFTGENLLEIERSRLLRIIDDTLQAFRQNGEAYDSDATTYLARWIGQLVTRDRETGCVWFGTSGRDGRDLIRLLPAGRRVVEFLETTDLPRQSVAASGLTDLCDLVEDASGRITGDAEAMITRLSTQRDDLNRRIADLQANGARKPNDRELREIGERIGHLTSTILAGFGAIPQEFEDHNRTNEELYADSDRPRNETLNHVVDRIETLTETPSYRMLTTLYQIHVDEEMKERLTEGLRIVRLACGMHLGGREEARLTGLLSEMAKIATRMHLEQARAGQQMVDFIKTGDFVRRRESVRLVRTAQSRITDIRDKVRPTPKDARIADLGFRIMEGLGAGPLVDLRLSIQIPDNAPSQAAEPVAEHDAEAVARQNVAEIAAARWVSTEATRGRIAAALAGREEIALSEVLERFPIRYGIHELSEYLTVAASVFPSRYVDGKHLSRTLDIEGTAFRVSCPDPVFCRTGEPGHGLAAVRGADGREVTALSIAPAAAREAALALTP